VNVVSKESIVPIFLMAALLAMFLAVACGRRPDSSPDAERTEAIPKNLPKEKEPQPVSLPAKRTETAEHKIKSAQNAATDPSADETLTDPANNKIDWGIEATLDEILAMAKSGAIQQIEWHVMPNIIRAQTIDGRIFHIKNENKGIDIRNTLIKSGIQVGKGGISFRHLF
jgi:hypothetical protein